MDPEAALASSVASSELRLAIQQLTREQRQVICLKFISGYDNSEIAATMGKKEGAIRALQYRALRSLQAILEAEERKTREFDFLPLGTRMALAGAVALQGASA